MSALAMTSTLQFQRIICCECGMEFCMTQDFYERRRVDHAFWYCPRGHTQHFTGESEVAKLKRELEASETARRWAETNAKGARIAEGRAKATTRRLQHRIACGVCPHCHRSFPKLAAHMKTKHPEAS